MVEKWDDKDKGERMIMKGKWKTRAMAFVMAFSMGMSSMISSSVYAAAEQPETKVETETQVFEEQTEEKVRAEDIVKDVSDKEFRVETSMEGISYDPERESVLLSEIKDQDGGSFQPENPGVYYAQYLVTPKDGSEPYMIGRTITLTDTEGLAHSESNGGEKQKEDTSSEEDSEQPLPVEITSSQPEDTPDVLAELERDIEEGNVMMLSAADGMGKSETVHLNKGRTIYYPDYLGNYLTCLFTVNGKLAYCLESHRASPPTGDYVADILESNKNLQKVLYYGYGGAGDITGSYLSGKSDDEKYVYTHLAASYAYCGDLAFTGCPYENLVNAGVIAYINHLFGMEEPPKGELSFSNANVTAVREGDIQKTPDITLNGDHRNKITIPVPQGVTGYNKSKGTNVSGGNLEVYGGDTFYLQAPLTVTGKWESGQLYGSVRESWKTLVLTSTGGNNQDIGAFISEKAAPVSFDIQWLNLARVKILKKDAETGNPLDGAVYAVGFLLEQNPSYIPPNIQEREMAKKPFALPERAKDVNRIWNYLKHRGISRETFVYCVNQGILYESLPYHNVVFVGRDEKGQARYAFLRGIYDRGKPFKMEQSGSDKAYSFCVPPSGKCCRVAVYEAAIETLAHMTLEGNRTDKYRLSVGGIYAPKDGRRKKEEKPPLALEHFLENHPEVTQIEICTNNDGPGRYACETMKRTYRDRYEILMEICRRISDAVRNL